MLELKSKDIKDMEQASDKDIHEDPHILSKIQVIHAGQAPSDKDDRPAVSKP